MMDVMLFKVGNIFSGSSLNPQYVRVELKSFGLIIKPLRAQSVWEFSLWNI